MVYTSDLATVDRRHGPGRFPSRAGSPTSLTWSFSFVNRFSLVTDLVAFLDEPVLHLVQRFVQNVRSSADVQALVLQVARCRLLVMKLHFQRR